MRRLRIGAARPRAATALLAVSLGTACGGSSPRAEFIVTAAGAQGQFIFAVLRERLVVVVTSNNDDARWVAPVGFLVSHILPAIREPRR